MRANNIRIEKMMTPINPDDPSDSKLLQVGNEDAFKAALRIVGNVTANRR